MQENPKTSSRIYTSIRYSRIISIIPQMTDCSRTVSTLLYMESTDVTRSDQGYAIFMIGRKHNFLNFNPGT